jgi:hypothetical protein
LNGGLGLAPKAGVFVDWRWPQLFKRFTQSKAIPQHDLGQLLAERWQRQQGLSGVFLRGQGIAHGAHILTKNRGRYFTRLEAYKNKRFTHEIGVRMQKVHKHKALRFLGGGL